MVTALEYRHVPTGTLAVLAQRLGKVWASPSTWYHLVRKFGWRRPRLRVHPAKPKVGLRTTQANEMWHIDTTVIRLLDGTRAYLHAVIDNFSRRILAWRVADMFAPVNTVAVLLEASRGTTRSETTPVVLADAGVENVNAQVDDLITTGLLRRVLAFTELKFPNSMIEAWWRSLKHQWLFLHSLESATWCTPSMLVSFKGQLRGVDCWWGRWTVSFCDIALDLGSLENPWCVRAGLCRSQPFQPDQTKDRGGCDAKDDSDFTDRHLATGLTFPWCPKNASVRLCRRPRPWSAAAERRGIVRLVQSGGKM